MQDFSGKDCMFTVFNELTQMAQSCITKNNIKHLTKIVAVTLDFVVNQKIALLRDNREREGKIIVNVPASLASVFSSIMVMIVSTMAFL